MTGPYSSFFELRDNPFRANPDPHYLFLTQQTQKSLEQLMNGIHERKGLMLLTGEVGTGKTVLLNRLREWLRQEQMPTAFIFNSHLKASELLDLVLADFGIPFLALRGSPLAHINSWLEDRFRAGQTPVLFVDEAQGLPRRALEELRMLLNLQTTEGNLLQIVLCGQPEFEESLTHLEFRPIHQRIALRCRTLPLTREETQSYIECRRRIAGDSGNPIFVPEALDALFLYSRGIPRVLNLLCEQALTRAAREKVRLVSARMVGESAHEFQFDSVKPLPPDSASSGAVLSDLFAPGLILGGLPKLAEASTQIGCYTQLNANSASTPNPLPQEEVPPIALNKSDRAPAAPTLSSPTANKHASAPSRSSNAPIVFPSPHAWTSPPASTPKETTAGCKLTSQAGTSTEQLLAALSASPGIVAPLLLALTPVSKQKFDFRKHWKLYGLSAAQTLNSAFSAGASFTWIHLTRVRVSSLAFLQSLTRRWSFWRIKDWNVSISFRAMEFATSCLQWLRAPSNARNVCHAPLKPYRLDAHTESAACVPASHAPQRHPRPQASYLNRLCDRERCLRLTAAILHWLRQPTHTIHGRHGSTLSQHSHRLT
jgi:general secretion pathway protein A